MIKYNGKTYEPLSTLEVELDSNAHGYAACEKYQVTKTGKSRMKIIAKHLPEIEKDLETEWNAYLDCQRQEADEMEVIDRNKHLSQANKNDLKAKVTPAVKRFRLRFGRSLKPLRSLKVVDDLGILPSEENARQKAIDDGSDFRNLMQEYVALQKQFMEMQLKNQKAK